MALTKRKSPPGIKPGDPMTIEKVRVDQVLKHPDGRIFRVYRQFGPKMFQVFYYPEMNGGEGHLFGQGQADFDGWEYVKEWSERERPLPERDLKDTMNGFLSPEGKLYWCHFTEHNSLEERIVAFFGIEEKRRPGKHWWELEDAGYIKLQSGDWYRPEFDPPTQAQLDTIFAWYKANEGQPFNSWIEDWKESKIAAALDPLTSNSPILAEAARKILPKEGD